MKRRNEIIKEIGDSLTDAINVLTDSFSQDYCEESGSRSYECSATIKYECGGKEYVVGAWAEWPHFGAPSLEVEISGGIGKAGRWKYYDSLQEAIVVYLYANISMPDLLGSLLEQLRDSEEDEWERHGFRDEADYVRWRYGR